MQPLISDGDYVIYRPFFSSRFFLREGESVVSRNPINVNTLIIKRVSTVYNSGVQLLGDNYNSSTDSRDFGPITSDEILSKEILKIWSNRISRFYKNIFHCVI